MHSLNNRFEHLLSESTQGSIFELPYTLSTDVEVLANLLKGLGIFRIQSVIPIQNFCFAFRQIR